MGKRTGWGMFKICSEKDTALTVCMKAILVAWAVIFLKDWINERLLRILVSPENFEFARWCNFLFHGIVTIPFLYWLLGFKELASKSRNSNGDE